MNPNGGIDMSKLGKEVNPQTLKRLIHEGKKEKMEENVIPMSQMDQCFELGRTVKCRIGPSTVHGVGVIAMRDIAVGEQLFCALTMRPVWYKVSLANLQKHLGEVHPEVLQLILDRWPHVVNDQPFLNPNYDARLTSFMNHSNDENYDPLTDTAKRCITKGEEIFVDYRRVENWQLIYPWLHNEK